MGALHPGFIGSSEMASSVLVGVCAGGASSAFAYLFYTVWFERERVALAIALDERGLPRRAPRASIGVRVAALITAICLAPTGLFSAMARVGFVRAARAELTAGIDVGAVVEVGVLVLPPVWNAVGVAVGVVDVTEELPLVELME